MADETYNLEARISMDTGQAAKSLDKLADEFISLNEATEHSSDMVDRWERRMVSAGKNARIFTTNVGKGSGALKQQASAVAAIAAEYQKLSRTEGTNIADMYLKGADEVQVAVQRIKNSERDRVEFAKAQTAEYRQAEAEKTRALQAAEKERFAYAQQANTQRVQMETKTRERELSSLRAAIQERARLQAQSAKAEGPAYLENARRDLGGLVTQANGLGVARGLARDFLGEFRNSSDIDRQRAYLDMMEDSMSGLANQRYALYDVATTMTAITVATTGLVVAANLVEAGYDKAFGQVARTTRLTGDELTAMRDGLEGLSHELPTAFGEITEIATIGAQMNIANESLEGFTETVAQFSATTGTSVNETAMSLGRLAQLTGTSQSEISNLASSIYLTGINSVATEQQILEVASQIATAGNLAGFTNTEIIGLSSALASLGVAPEQSRGAIMRVFGDITEAVSTGGDSLAAFAATSGMSAQEFKTQWGENSQDVFTGYINGLSQLDKGLLDVTLKQQGFINVRDRNVLTRLANNTEVYAQALTDAGVAYSENTALAEGYNTATDNLIDNATRLRNVLLDIAQSAGNSAVFNVLAKGALGLATALESIISTPAGQVILGIVAGFTALVGITAAAVAVYATLTASLLAVTTGLRYVQSTTGTTTLGVRALTIELLRMTASTNGASAALFGLANANTRVAAATRIATTALRGMAVATGIGAILVGATYALEAFTNSMKSASDQAKAYYDSAGINADFSEAIKQDTAAFQENGKALRVVTSEAQTNKAATDVLGDSILRASGIRQQSKSTTEGDTAAVQNNTVALGENARAQAASVLAQDERVRRVWEERQALEALGFSFEAWTNAILTSPTGGEDYLSSIGLGIDDITNSKIVTDEYVSSVRLLGGANADLQATINEQSTSLQINNAIMGEAGVAATGAAEGFEEVGAAAEGSGNKIQEAIDKIYGTVDSSYAVQEALFGVGESLYENGNAFDAYSEAGRANMDAVSQAVSAMAANAGEDTGLFTANVAGLLAQLQAQGINTGNELGWVGNLLNDLTGRQWGIDFNSKAARQDILAFIQTSIKALQVRAQLERQRIAAANAANEAARLSASVFSSSGTPSPMRLMPVPDSGELNQIEQSIKAMQGLYSSAAAAATATSSVGAGAKSAGTSMQQGYGKGAEAASKAAQATKDAADKTKDMQKEVRTLEDYANDLSTVMDRVVELMFGNQQAKDNVFDILGGMRGDIEDGKDAIYDARRAVFDLRSDLKDARVRVVELGAELRSLHADRRVLQYQLKVAVEYGDDLRAAEIRAELAENNAEIISTEKERSDANRDVILTQRELTEAEKEVAAAIRASSTALTGNSKAARENRARVMELLAAYQKQITTAAANGATTSQLRALTAKLSDEFGSQLTQMGYNRAEVNRYRYAFSNFATTLKGVPRNVTVTASASTSAASRALNEWRWKKRSTTVDVKLGRTPSVGDIGAGRLRPSGVSVGSGGISTPRLSASNTSTNKMTALNFNAEQGPTRYTRRATGGSVNYLASGGVGGMHPGKPKGTDTIPAWLSDGEFVQRQKAVSHYGLPFMNAVNSLQFPKYLASGSGSSGGAPSVGIVELLPRQLAQLAQMVSSTVVLDGKVVATAVNNQNRTSSIRKVN